MQRRAWHGRGDLSCLVGHSWRGRGWESAPGIAPRPALPPRLGHVTPVGPGLGARRPWRAPGHRRDLESRLRRASCGWVGGAFVEADAEAGRPARIPHTSPLIRTTMPSGAACIALPLLQTQRDGRQRRHVVDASLMVFTLLRDRLAAIATAHPITADTARARRHRTRLQGAFTSREPVIVCRVESDRRSPAPPLGKVGASRLHRGWREGFAGGPCCQARIGQYFCGDLYSGPEAKRSTLGRRCPFGSPACDLGCPLDVLSPVARPAPSSIQPCDSTLHVVSRYSAHPAIRRSTTVRDDAAIEKIAEAQHITIRVSATASNLAC